MGAGWLPPLPPVLLVPVIRPRGELAQALGELLDEGVRLGVVPGKVSG
jgi:hypothetical protein